MPLREPIAADIHPSWCGCGECQHLYDRWTRTPFYNPATRTFRPFSRQAILTLLAAPALGALIALLMAVL